MKQCVLVAVLVFLCHVFVYDQVVKEWWNVLKQNMLTAMSVANNGYNYYSVMFIK